MLLMLAIVVVMLLLLMMMHCVATTTIIVLLVLQVVMVLLVRRVRCVEPVFVLKISAHRVREQVGEVIVRVVIVRLVHLLIRIVRARHHPIRVRTMGGEGIRDFLGEQEVREFVRITPAARHLCFPKRD